MSADKNRLSGCRSDSFLGCENSLEIQWIGGDDGNRLARTFATETAEQFHRFRQRKLLAGETADESAASYFTSKLHSAVNSREGEPGDRQFLAHDGAAEDDAGAAEQLLCGQLVLLFNILLR